MTLFQIIKKHKIDQCLGSTENYQGNKKAFFSGVTFIFGYIWITQNSGVYLHARIK